MKIQYIESQGRIYVDLRDVIGELLEGGYKEAAKKLEKRFED